MISLAAGAGGSIATSSLAIGASSRSATDAFMRSMSTTTSAIILRMIMEQRKSNPIWERGYRSHGYWRGIIRLGWVSLSPRPVTDYGWLVKVEGYSEQEGRVSSL